MAWSISLERYALPPPFISSIYPPLTPVDAPLLRRYSARSSPAKPFTLHNELQKKCGVSAAEPLIKVPRSNCLCGSKARRGCNIWTPSVRQKGGGGNRRQQGDGAADWINTASDWLATVYSPRANQRHRICPPMRRSSISALPLPPSILAPGQKRQSIRRLSLALFRL